MQNRYYGFIFVLALLLVAQAHADDVTALICPFDEEGSGLSIGGYTIDSSLWISSTSREGVVLSHGDLWQQAGEAGGTAVDQDNIIEGQGYSYSLNGQGSWQYSGGWNVTGNQIDTERLLNLERGRMNPWEESLMMSYACPPDTESPYQDNLTHVIGAETAYSENMADLFAGGYASQGRISPGLLTADMAIKGTGAITWSGGYNAITGIARNTSVPVTTYVLQGRIMVPVTTMEDRNAIVGTGHTIYQGWYHHDAAYIEDVINFRYVGTRSAPY